MKRTPVPNPYLDPDYASKAKEAAGRSQTVRENAAYDRGFLRGFLRGVLMGGLAGLMIGAILSIVSLLMYA